MTLMRGFDLLTLPPTFQLQTGVLAVKRAAGFTSTELSVAAAPPRWATANLAPITQISANGMRV